MKKCRVLAVLVLTLLIASPAIAQQAPAAPEEMRPVPDEQASVTEHTIVVDGETVPYQRRAQRPCTW